jgi:hypothetical protein
MFRLKPISLYEWIEIGFGTFFMGLGLGLTFSGFSIGPVLFFIGFLIEIPSLISLKRHKK